MTTVQAYDNVFVQLMPFLLEQQLAFKWKENPLFLFGACS